MAVLSIDPLLQRQMGSRSVREHTHVRQQRRNTPLGYPRGGAHHSLGVQILNHGHDDDDERDREDLASRANKGGEDHGVTGRPEHVSMDLLPPILIPQVPVLQQEEAGKGQVYIKTKGHAASQNQTKHWSLNCYSKILKCMLFNVSSCH